MTSASRFPTFRAGKAPRRTRTYQGVSGHRASAGDVAVAALIVSVVAALAAVGAVVYARRLDETAKAAAGAAKEAAEASATTAALDMQRRNAETHPPVPGNTRGPDSRIGGSPPEGLSLRAARAGTARRPDRDHAG